jgi:hypothetical protein
VDFFWVYPLVSAMVLTMLDFVILPDCGIRGASFHEGDFTLMVRG